MERCDVLVLGLGAMGSAALYQSAKRGARAIGIDRFAPPHAQGSSHGETRITRLAIGEGAHYTPLALRSHAIWRELEKATGAALLTRNGGLILSSRRDLRATIHVPDFFANTLAAAQAHGIAHEILDADAIRARFPQFRVRDEEFAYYEPEAGFLRPEACIAAQLTSAARHRAEIRNNECALAIESDGENVALTTDKARYRAKRLILTAGPWVADFLPPEWAGCFRVTRQVQYWFAASDTHAFEPARCPVYIWELPHAAQGIYGFPAADGPGSGVKIATEQTDETTRADGVNRAVTPAETAAMFETYVAPYFPTLTPLCLKTATCLYTVTPDSGFVIDRHPLWPSVIVASPCSGHGFKHSAAIGERLAQWALEETPFDPGPFAFSRFSKTESPWVC